jgi:outer membrane autotransporter protein
LTFGQSTLSGRNAFVAQWNGSPYYYNGGGLNYFQVVLIDRSNRHAGDFDVEFNYNSIATNPSYHVAVGIGEGTANPANTKELPGSQGTGSGLADTGANALVNGTNVGVLGRYFFQIINGVIFFGPPNLGFLLPTNAPTNVFNVANNIDAFTNGGGTLPSSFDGLFTLTPDQLSAALSQLSGEAATGAQTGAFQLMNSFLGLMVDQSLDAGNGNGVGLASGFAPERQALPADVALAYASMLKAPPARSSQPWSVWGSAYGGTNHANGDSVVVGSHDVRTNTWGIAAGIDYRLSPDTKIGFALGGAGTNWGLSDGLGGGKSDAFQAGIYGLTRSGPAYLSGALAFSSYWVSTDRIAFASDQLTANFNAYGIGGRLEGGYRFATPVVGFTPYAALQAQSFHIPSYSETDVTGGGFGLAFNEHTASDTRSELGARFDKQVALDNGAVLALRGRAAWAHDWVTDPSLTAAFLALPGGGTFIVNGATPAHDSALVTAGAEIKLRSGWAVMAKFDGEFASSSQTYTGTGKLRYTW